MVYITGKTLSSAKEILDGAVYKYYNIVEKLEKETKQLVGYTMEIGVKDIDDPKWKSRGFIPQGFLLITTDLDSLEEILARIVPDGTVTDLGLGLPTAEFNWVKHS